MTNSKIKILPVQSTDDLLANLPNENWAEGIRESIRQLNECRGHLDTFRGLEARCKGEVVGALVHEPIVFGEAYFHWASVKPAECRKGIATKLFHRMREILVSEAKVHGLNSITIAASNATDEGTSFLKAMGFEEKDGFWNLDIDLSDLELTSTVNKEDS